jgi:hypothetical protein
MRNKTFATFYIAVLCAFALTGCSDNERYTKGLEEYVTTLERRIEVEKIRFEYCSILWAKHPEFARESVSCSIAPMATDL